MSKVFQILDSEIRRQKNTINLIASENYVSENVKKVVGSELMNKYAEGLPGKRYYSGCEFVDEVENLAIELCKKLFGAEWANVQPHSGSNANMAVYFGLLNPGDTILGMSLECGGHLTHGHKINFSGKHYNIVQYGVDLKTGLLDYDSVALMTKKHKPKIIIAGTSAYSRLIDYEKMAEIAESNDSILMADMAHIAGLVAAKVIPSPIPYSDIVTTTTHKTLRGPRGGIIMGKEKFSRKLDRAVMPGIQGGPHMNLIAGKAVALEEAFSEEFIECQKRTVENAKTMAEEFKRLGYKIVTGGTDNHQVLVDLREGPVAGMTGKEAEEILEKNGITVNRNTIPGETKPPGVTSGIRIGTAAISTMGFGFDKCKKLVNLIDQSLSGIEISHCMIKEFQRCEDYFSRGHSSI